MAEAEGQPVEPQNMTEARHDLRDCQRFGLGVQMGTERFLNQAVQFGPDGGKGLLEEVVAPLFRTGKTDERLSAQAVSALSRAATHAKNVAIYFGRGLDLVRFQEVLRVWRAVKLKEHVLHLEDFDTIKSVAVGLAAMRSGASAERLQVINAIGNVDDLFANLRALIMGEAHRLLDSVVEEDPRFPPSPPPWVGWELLSHWTQDPVQAEEKLRPGDLTVQALVEEELEKAVVRAALCLDLAPNYDQIVAQLVARGELAEEVIESFLRDAAADPEQQVAVVNARRALEAARARRGQGALADLGEMRDDAEMLGDIVRVVDEIAELLPERFHTCTSGPISPLRRALREFEAIRRRHPTDPGQLPHLAMALVRMDRVDHYEALLDRIRWMREHAVGEALWRKGTPMPEITPGLLKVAEEEGGIIGQTARSLAEELAETPYERLREPRRVV